MSPCLHQFFRCLLVIVGQSAGLAGGPARCATASATAPGSSSLPICQSSACFRQLSRWALVMLPPVRRFGPFANRYPIRHCFRFRRRCSRSILRRSACRCVLVMPQFSGLGEVASIAAPGPSISVGGDGDIQTHDGPVDKTKLATVPTTLPGSTGRNPEK